MERLVSADNGKKRKDVLCNVGGAGRNCTLSLPLPLSLSLSPSPSPSPFPDSYLVVTALTNLGAQSIGLQVLKCEITGTCDLGRERRILYKSDFY